jgi:hypothetical protein
LKEGESGENDINKIVKDLSRAETEVEILK